MGAAVFAFTSFSPGNGVPCFVVAMCTTQIVMGIADGPSIGLMSSLAQERGRGNGEAVTASELAVTAGQALGPSVGAFVQQAAGFDYLCLMLSGCAAAVSAIAWVV